MPGLGRSVSSHGALLCHVTPGPGDVINMPRGSPGGVLAPPSDGAHRYRVEAQEDQLPLLLTQLREVYDVSIRGLSFQGIIHLAAILFPGEDWEDFLPSRRPPGSVTIHKSQVTGHKAGARTALSHSGGRPGAEEERREINPLPGKGKTLPHSQPQPSLTSGAPGGEGQEHGQGQGAGGGGSGL